jgi:hypothetical protein
MSSLIDELEGKERLAIRERATFTRRDCGERDHDMGRKVPAVPVEGVLYKSES